LANSIEFKRISVILPNFPQLKSFICFVGDFAAVYEFCRAFLVLLSYQTASAHRENEMKKVNADVTMVSRVKDWIDYFKRVNSGSGDDSAPLQSLLMPLPAQIPGSPNTVPILFPLFPSIPRSHEEMYPIAYPTLFFGETGDPGSSLLERFVRFP
jgi:hypothetical protein